jgi:hypothetical protein
MKKAFVFLFSRTLEKDYRLITSIDDPNFPNELLQRAEARATGLIRATDKQLEDPQWLFMKEGSCAIWGLACMNKILDERYSLDKTDTPIRCFMALAIPNYNGEPIPFEINAFATPFCKVMDGLFADYQSYVNNIIVDLPVSNECVSPNIWNENLNTDIRYCKFFSNDVDSTSLLGAAIGYKGDISIAINVAKEECVNDEKVCPPMNAVMRNSTSLQSVKTGLRPPPIITDDEEIGSNDPDNNGPEESVIVIPEDKDGELNNSDNKGPLEPKFENYWKKIVILFSLLVLLFAAIHYIKRSTNRSRPFNIPNSETPQQMQIRSFIDDTTVVNVNNNDNALSKERGCAVKSVSNEHFYDTVNMIAH